MGKQLISNIVRLIKRHSDHNIKHSVLFIPYVLIVFAATIFGFLGMAYVIVTVKDLTGNYVYLSVPILVIIMFVGIVVGMVLINQLFRRIISPLYKVILNILNHKP